MEAQVRKQMKLSKLHIYSGTARLRDAVISYSLLQRSSLDQPACHFCYRSNDMLLYAKEYLLDTKASAPSEGPCSAMLPAAALARRNAGSV